MRTAIIISKMGRMTLVMRSCLVNPASSTHMGLGPIPRSVCGEWKIKRHVGGVVIVM